MPGVGSGLLLRRRERVYSALSAVVAYARCIANIDRRFVHIVNDCDVNVVNGTIIEKASVVPMAAFETSPKVSVAIIDSAIEAHNLIGPVTFIKGEPAAAPSPVPRSPQETDFRSWHPCSRNPVVIAVVLVPSPVPRSPEIALLRANRLLVNW